MQLIVNETNSCVLKFERGEEVISTLKTFCKSEHISSGFFHGLGACSYLKLAYYYLPEKKYGEKEFRQDLEIVNLVGNIAASDNDLVVHAHGTFSNQDFNTIAGHVVSLEVSATCELMITKFEAKMRRKLDPEIGLKLLSTQL